MRVRLKVESVAPVSTRIWQDSLLTLILVSPGLVKGLSHSCLQDKSLKSSETEPYGPLSGADMGHLSWCGRICIRPLRKIFFQCPSGLQMRQQLLDKHLDHGPSGEHNTPSVVLGAWPWSCRSCEISNLEDFCLWSFSKVLSKCLAVVTSSVRLVASHPISCLSKIH